MSQLARQIDSRNQLLEETEAGPPAARGDRPHGQRRRDSANRWTATGQYAEMVREAYRNYKHNNYLTYIFSSRDLRRHSPQIVNLREVASMRERKLQDIAALSKQVARGRNCSTAANGRSTPQRSN